MENAYDADHDFTRQLNEQENRLRREGTNVDPVPSLLDRDLADSPLLLIDGFDPISPGASASFQRESNSEDDSQAEDESFDSERRAQRSTRPTAGQVQEGPPINENPTTNPVNKLDVMTLPNFRDHDSVQAPIISTTMAPIEALQVSSAGLMSNPATEAQSGLSHKQFMPAQGQPLECRFPGCTQGVLSRRDLLKRHIMTRHTQEQGVACSKCNRWFSRRDNYQKHALKCGKKRKPKAQKARKPVRSCTRTPRPRRRR